MARKKLPRSPYLNPKFSAAVKEFGIALLKTQSINHKGNRGSAREGALHQFFKGQLPSRYAVTEGEVVDLRGNTSPQLDLMFYDSSVNFPFTAEGADILAAEALLASIEVKSNLTAQEIVKSADAARKLRALQPFGRSLTGIDVGDNGTVAKSARYFHCIFAYGTDLTSEDWISKEYKRLQSACNGDHLFNLVYVLGLGLIHVDHNIGRLEDEDGGAITNFYFSVINFIQRESRRRGVTPFERYTQPASKAWVKL